MVHSRSVRACRWLAQAGLPFWPASRLFFSVTFVSGIASEVRLVSPVHFVSDGDLREILAKVFRRVVLRIPAEWALDFSPIGSPIHGGAGIAPLCRVRKPCSACPIEARSGHVTTNVGRPLGSSAHWPTPMHALPCVFPERSRRSRRLLRRVTRTRSVSCDAFAQKRPSKRTAPVRGNRRRGDSPPRGAVRPR